MPWNSFILSFNTIHRDRESRIDSICCSVQISTWLWASSSDLWSVVQNSFLFLARKNQVFVRSFGNSVLAGIFCTLCITVVWVVFRNFQIGVEPAHSESHWHGNTWLKTRTLSNSSRFFFFTSVMHFSKDWPFLNFPLSFFKFFLQTCSWTRIFTVAIPSNVFTTAKLVLSPVDDIQAFPNNDVIVFHTDVDIFLTTALLLYHSKL